MAKKRKKAKKIEIAKAKNPTPTNMPQVTVANSADAALAKLTGGK